MKKSMTAVYWVVTVILAVLAAVGVAGWSVDQAPTLDDDKGAAVTSASHALYGIVGGVIGFALVLAVASAIWMIMWARRRRATHVDDYDDYDHDLDLLDDEREADERGPSGERGLPAEPDEARARR